LKREAIGRTDFPDYLRHSDADTPIPTWQQVTRSEENPNEPMVGHVSRIVANCDDPQMGKRIWESWPGKYRRSVALLIDKMFAEGLLDCIGGIRGWPWDGGFFFRPGCTDQLEFDQFLDGLSGKDGVYTKGSFREGLLPYLSGWHHKGWRQSWMENDVEMGALHVGLFDNQIAEVHFDVFNSLYTNGAPTTDVISIPLIGSYNRRMYSLHRRWESPPYAQIVRTSANLYHILRESVSLSF
jgi:hypothetical protein